MFALRLWRNSPIRSTCKRARDNPQSHRNVTRGRREDVVFSGVWRRAPAGVFVLFGCRLVKRLTHDGLIVEPYFGSPFSSVGSRVKKINVRRFID